jgi:hypothetical protein
MRSVHSPLTRGGSAEPSRHGTWLA